MGQQYESPKEGRGLHLGILVVFLVVGVVVGIGIGILASQGQVNDLQGRIDDLSAKVKSLTDQLQSVKSQNEELDKENKALKRLNDELKRQLDHVKEENEELKALVAENSQTCIVEQPPGGLVYWVLPGPRRLSPSVFGTPEKPTFGTARLTWAIREAERLPPPLNETVPQLLRKLPFLVAVPDDMRRVVNGQMYLTVPTLFSDEARVVDGSMHIEFIDRIPYDVPGPPTNTPDAVKADIRFTDPAGNTYRLRIKKVFMPPIPGYETGGGVIIGAWHHGTTGTASPLMPRVFTYGAFWAIGDVEMNGKVIEENVVIHAMTTQVVRDKDYRLAVDEELPLAPVNTPAGQLHHTHVVVFPIKVTPKGPVFHPLNLGFELPNGKPQPFIHVMFEQDRLVRCPYANFTLPQRASAAESEKASTQGTGPANKSVTVTIEAYEWKFDPSIVRVKKGQEVTIVFVNEGTFPHNLYISGYNVKTETIGPGRKYMVKFVADKTGKFAFWCTVPGHREAGLEGVLIVEP